MTNEAILITLIAIIISLSGIFINLLKKGGDRFILIKDGGSLLVFRVLIPVGLLVSLFLYFSHIGHFNLPSPLIYFGYIFIIGGLLIRWYAVYTLGNAFTVKIGIIKDQSLITSGIYSKVRHPSYTGLLLYYLGLGIIMENWICLLILAFLPLYVVLFRIKKEEAVLRNHFGKVYETYMLKSYKLLPFLY